jgi:Imidazoleglycerol-phosphate dehydratase
MDESQFLPLLPNTHSLLPMARTAEVSRTTKETTLRARVNLDGTGEARVKTGLGFFDHMLEAFARHGLLDLELEG